jgi:hypothetical protein
MVFVSQNQHIEYEGVRLLKNQVFLTCVEGFDLKSN